MNLDLVLFLVLILAVLVFVTFALRAMAAKERKMEAERQFMAEKARRWKLSEKPSEDWRSRYRKP